MFHPRCIQREREIKLTKPAMFAVKYQVGKILKAKVPRLRGRDLSRAPSWNWEERSVPKTVDPQAGGLRNAADLPTGIVLFLCLLASRSLTPLPINTQPDPSASGFSVFRRGGQHALQNASCPAWPGARGLQEAWESQASALRMLQGPDAAAARSPGDTPTPTPDTELPECSASRAKPGGDAGSSAVLSVSLQG